ncbi:RagB/SusD family nutrient uptake outer membrane protein [Foetidibacter luteolus]|uniref:RagB/SusD family nutrient uptake outer membrane protein n=1 Tax=Foetidibacter luteolus TaxID=2608880 RepID=UPI00129A50DF|nr:RagB/SusD family nutrient uptake outer membrane protein [Foetidibacter luteolus]
MKNISKNIAIFLSVGLMFTACSRDFLDTQPLDKASADNVWNDAALSELFVTDIYNAIRDGLLNQESMDCITDNALYNFGRMDIMEANISPTNVGWVNNTYDWNEMYARIRAANIALENLSKATFDAGAVDRLKGETYFMRAYCYNQMLRYYGGVPIIKSTYTLNSPDFTIARNTYEECVDAIISDLDSSAMLLNGKNMALGRATTDAAMALKARVLLYAASDLHDIPTAKAKSSVINGFSNPELLGYVSGDRTARWQKAKDAAKAVMDLGKYGYMLDLGAPLTKDEAITAYTNVYLSRGGGERESIFSKYYINASPDDWGAWYPRNNTTNGYHGWTSSEPTQNLVDSYEMMDGTKFDWSKPEQAADPYANRDPRFYASVFYDGCKWKPRTTDGAAVDPYGEIQFGTYEVGSSSSPAVYFGLDTRNSSIENWNGTRTGYSIRKFTNDDPAIVDMNQRQEIPSIQIRFTEVVFNYIEACLELGEEAEAKTWLNRIRFRAGMPAITESGDALVKRYQNERNIEMMFEEQRFYDARRWMIAPDVLGQKVRIMKITGKLKAGKTVNVYRYSKDNYDYTYTVQNIESGVENRSWHDKLYFPPIRLDEMNKNNKLIQNPGY